MIQPIRSWARPLVAGACLLVLGAGAASAYQNQAEVHALNQAYVPASLAVPAGTTVRFINDDAEIHTVTQRGGGFDSGLLFAGNSWTFVFNEPGTYEYFCLPHPWLSGTIVVE